jgi:hypothetical protein
MTTIDINYDPTGYMDEVIEMLTPEERGDLLDAIASDYTPSRWPEKRDVGADAMKVIWRQACEISEQLGQIRYGRDGLIQWIREAIDDAQIEWLSEPRDDSMNPYEDR